MSQHAGRPAPPMTPFREIRIKRRGRPTLSAADGDTVISIPTRNGKPRELVKNLSIHFPEGTVINLRFRLERSRSIAAGCCEEIYRLEDLGIGQELATVETGTIREAELELEPLWPPSETKAE